MWLVRLMIDISDRDNPPTGLVPFSRVITLLIYPLE